MKRILNGFIFLLFLAAAGFVQAQPVSKLDDRLQTALATQSSQGVNDYLAAPDQYGTPLIIKLARQGDMQTLVRLAAQTSSGQFLLAKDVYGNNIFHVAKDATTVQKLAALLRHYFDPKASAQIRALMDETNQSGETPVHAQINAGRADTFYPIFAYTTLKQKNDKVQKQIARLRGMDERIVSQHQEIYCQEIQKLGSAHGQTILQAAQLQAQATQQPQMRELANYIQRNLPCLAL